MSSGNPSAVGAIAQPLAAEGGIDSPPSSEREPYALLDDLMVVVEALCPEWPERETFRSDGIWLL